MKPFIWILILLSSHNVWAQWHVEKTVNNVTDENTFYAASTYDQLRLTSSGLYFSFRDGVNNEKVTIKIRVDKHNMMTLNDEVTVKSDYSVIGLPYLAKKYRKGIKKADQAFLDVLASFKASNVDIPYNKHTPLYVEMTKFDKLIGQMKHGDQMLYEITGESGLHMRDQIDLKGFTRTYDKITEKPIE